MSYETRKSDTHEEKYMHVDVDGVRTKKATIYARRERDDDRWYFSTAFCSHGDAFNRKLGRAIARRRYFNEPGNRIALGSSFLPKPVAAWTKYYAP